MKSKIIIVTDTGWWDTDITVIPYLKQHFSLDIHLIINKKNNKFSTEEVDDFKRKNEVEVTLWQRPAGKANPLNYFLFAKMYRYIKWSNRDKSAILHYIYTYDPWLNLVIFFTTYYKKLISIHDYKEQVGLKNNQIRETLKRTIIKKNNLFHFYSAVELAKFKHDYPGKNAFFTEMPLKNFGENITVYEKVPVENKKLLLFFGYIRHYKGLDILLQALNKLQQDNYVLLIAGYAYNWAEYEELVKGNKNIMLKIGFLENKEIGNYLLQADYLVCPYRSATQSGPVLFALNYNVPIIASDLEIFSQYITSGVDGFLFKKEDVNSLTEVLKTAIGLEPAEYKILKEQQYKKRAVYDERVKVIGDIFRENILKFGK